MTQELIETLRLIIERYGERTTGSIFILMQDFPWYNERNGQLTQLQAEGMITKPRFYDNGAEISLTKAGRHFFDEGKGHNLTKERRVEILRALAEDINSPFDSFGYEKIQDYWADLDVLYKQGFIRLERNPIYDEHTKRPLKVWLDGAVVTQEGLKQIEGSISTQVDLPHEFISVCSKIADNPVSYGGFDEDGLNREVRNLLDSGISRFGYNVGDQTQQGIGKTDKKAGELDIRITKQGIPIAIYEGLIHRDKQYLYGHISKAIGRYNKSGCKAVYIVEFSRNKGFGSFWDNSIEALEEYNGIEVHEENTCLLGVKMLKGTFDWECQKGDFYYIGVNCYSK